MKVRGKVAEISLGGKFLRKAMKSQEIRRNSRALLLHNTVVNYISKAQKGMSELLREACTEARKGNASIKQQVRDIGGKFANNVEISAQEAVYLVLQLPM